VTVIERAADLPAAWDTLAGQEDLFLSTRSLRTTEQVSGVPMRYLVTGALAGGLATALVPATAPWLLGRPDTLLQHCVDEGTPGAAECRARLPAELLPSLVCGGRHLGRTGPVVDPHRTDQPSIVDSLVDAAERLAEESGARSVSFLYVDERHTVLRAVLTARDYRRFSSAQYSWLPVPANGFAGYLETLSGHRRRRINAERRALSDAGVHTTIEPLTESLVLPMAELESALLTKYGATTSPEKSVPIFAGLLADFGADAMVSTARIDGRLCGFGLLLRHGNHWYANRGGFDYAATGRLPVYYEVGYYQVIEAAHRHGIEVIHYGIGSTHTKLSRGCSVAEQDAFILPLPTSRTDPGRTP
jgi:predicted N-acyltransferase